MVGNWLAFIICATSRGGSDLQRGSGVIATKCFLRNVWFSFCFIFCLLSLISMLSIGSTVNRVVYLGRNYIICDGSDRHKTYVF